jgi:hypothetical protein
MNDILYRTTLDYDGVNPYLGTTGHATPPFSITSATRIQTRAGIFVSVTRLQWRNVP